MSNLKKILKQHFGYNDFKQGQEEAIRNILACNDTLALMPTGGGKSICYQLPAILMQGVVVVISPLIALMKDQVDSLIQNGIPATSIDSTLSFSEIQIRFKAIYEGKIKLLYLAPERLASRQFLELLQNINISFLAVDEAHCISEWGHDFRPSYMNIHKIFNFIPRCPILALTATATIDVRNDIIRSLKLKNTKLVIKGFERKNLNYHCEYSENKVNRIADICSNTKNGSTIIYAGSRKRTEQFSNELREIGIKSEFYHAGMKTLLRTAVQERFITGKTKVIIATNAFGMGIDKRDVRNVIHIDYPLTLEAYYQESGRAGRDDEPADCYLLYNNFDKELSEFFIKSTFPSKEEIEIVYDKILSFHNKQDSSYNQTLAIPSPVLIANSITKDFRTVESVYNLLHRNNIITFGNIQSQTKLRFIASRERIYEYYNNLPDERQGILEAILRSVNSDVFDRFVSINLKDILFKHRISKKQFDDIVKSLQILQLAQYKNEASDSGYYFNKLNDNFAYLNIDFEDTNRRYANALIKLDQVYKYSITNTCKRNYLLDYFDDKSYNGNCNKCTSCKTNQIKNNTLTSINSLLRYIILDYLIENGQNVELSNLIKNVKNQLKSFNIFYFKQKELANFNNLVNNELKELNNRRLIKFINKHKSTILITEEGKIFVELLPEQFRIMARREKDKTASEIIFSKLVTLRREIAEHAGVVPRGIISDVALKKIAEVMPETEYDLKNVSGVSQLFVQKFAKLFLQELAKIKLNPKEQKVSKVAQDFLKMLDQGLDFEIIKSRLFGGNMSMASNYIVEIIEAGHNLPRKSMVPDSVYTKIKSCVKKYPDLTPREIQGKLTIEIEQPILKIAYSFAKAELGLL